MNNLLLSQLLAQAMEVRGAPAEKVKELRQQSRDLLLKEGAKHGVSEKDIERFLGFNERKVLDAAANFAAYYNNTGESTVRAMVEALLDDLREWATAAHEAQAKLGLAEPGGVGVFLSRPRLLEDEWHARFKADMDNVELPALRMVELTKLAYPALADVSSVALALNLTMRSLNGLLNAPMAEICVAACQPGFTRTRRAMERYLTRLEELAEQGSAWQARTGSELFYISRPSRTMAVRQMRELFAYVAQHPDLAGFDYAASNAEMAAVPMETDGPFTAKDNAVRSNDEAGLRALLAAEATA